MKRLRRKHLSHFANLPPDEKRAFIMALALIPTLALSLRILGFKRCHAWVEKTVLGPISTDTRMAPHLARLVAWAASYGVWRGNCLSQSLTLCRLLRERGLEGRLKIGVRREGEQIEAHAWVELNGNPLNDAAEVTQRFAPFVAIDRLPPASFG